MATAPRANCFDASALVKVYANEPGSPLVRNYFFGAATKYTTPFCFYEALNILKGKWCFRKQLTEAQYRTAASELVTWYASATRYLSDIELTTPEVLVIVREIAERHSLDFSDAFQIVSVKSGSFSRLVNRNQTVLVTADRKLAEAACAEGVLAWDVLSGSEP